MPRLENLPQTRISFRRSANNLHIATGEDLDLEQARAILNLMCCHSNDCNKFFIDVRHVTRIQPAAAAALRGASQPSIAPQRIHKKGKACLQGHLPQLPLQGQKGPRQGAEYGPGGRGVGGRRCCLMDVNLKQ